MGGGAIGQKDDAGQSSDAARMVDERPGSQGLVIGMWGQDKPARLGPGALGKNLYQRRSSADQTS